MNIKSYFLDVEIMNQLRIRLDLEIIVNDDHT